MQRSKDLLNTPLCFWDWGCREDSRPLCIFYPWKPRTASFCEGARRLRQVLCWAVSSHDTGISIVSLVACVAICQISWSLLPVGSQEQRRAWKASETRAAVTGAPRGRRRKAGGPRKLSRSLPHRLGSEAEPPCTELLSTRGRYLAWARKHTSVVIRHWHFPRSFVLQQNLVQPTAMLSLYGWRKQTFRDV